MIRPTRAWDRVLPGGLMTVRWRLYIDEAGLTGVVGTGSVAIAGILVPEPGFAPAVVDPERRRLRQEFPWLVWPLHRSRFTRPERHLLGFAATGWTGWPAFKALSCPSNPKEMMDKLVKDHTSIGSIVSGLRPSNTNKYPRELSIPTLDFVRPLLPATWATWLKDMENELFTRAATLARDVLARTVGATAFLVGEGEVGATVLQHVNAYPFASKKAATSKYLALLEVLLRRVGDFLLLTPGDHELELWASGIDVAPGTPLTALHIDALWQPAFGTAAPTCPGTALTRGTTAVVPYSTPNADPWFVVADFVSSLGRWPLHQNIHLAELAALAPARIGVTLDVQRLAASGPLHGFIQNERPLGSRPGGTRSLPTQPYVWALEQGRHWKAMPF